MARTAFYCSLSHEGILAVRGPDAGKFLQGQITCNINYLSANQSSLGARCTAKGRMLSSFRIVSCEDGFLLGMASELVESQLADFKKYAVFSKATLTDASSEWARFGLSDGDGVLSELGLVLPQESDAVVQHNGLLAVRLSDGRAELWAPAQQKDAIQTILKATLEEAPLNDWLLAQVRAGIGQVTGNTREVFIPQMLNLQALGGVSFKKGCYTGQEIVARMQYLGKLKRRLYRLALANPELPEPGNQLFSPVHNSSVGEVVLAARSDNAIELLAVLQEDAAADGRLTLSAADGNALKLLDLPYSLDPDRDIQR
jgi:folate-binding protein YgfZ